MRRSKRNNDNSKVYDEDDDDLWEFKSLKRTKKSGSKSKTIGSVRNQLDDVDHQDVLSANSKQEHKRTVSKTAKQRIKSLADRPETDDSDCQILDTQNLTDFKEDRKRAFLSSNRIDEDVICKSTSSKQCQLFIDNDELSQKITSPKSENHSQSSQVGGKTRRVSKSKTSKREGEKVKRSNSTKKKTKSPRKRRDEDSERCPFCQVPFSALLRLSPNAHTMECMDLPFLSSATECEDGLECISYLPLHYRKYRHSLLAELQASQCSIGDHRHTVVDHSSQDNHSTSSTEKNPTNVAMVTALKEDDCEDDESISFSPLSENDVGESPQSHRPSLASTQSSPIHRISSPSTPVSSRGNTGHKTINSRKNIGNNFSCESDEEKSVSSRVSDNSAQKTIKRKELSCESDKDDKCVVEDDVQDGGFFMEDEQDMDDGDKDLAELLMGSDDDDNISDDDDYKIIDIHDNIIDNDDIEDKIKDNDDTDIQHDNTVSCLMSDKLCDDIDITGDVDKCENNTDNDNDTQSLKDDPVNKSNTCTIDLSNSNSPAKSSMQCLARKQTSIFSYFNGPKDASKPGTSGSDTKCDISDLKKGLARIGSTIVRGSSAVVGALKRSASDMTMMTSNTFSAPAAAQSDASSGRGKFGNKKVCPFYKKIPDTSLTVDAFRYGVIPGCRAYVLTHFHYDHYGGLSKHFKQALYCSKVTGNLVKSKIKVDARYVHTLPMETPQVVEGVELTLLEANHCPGAVIIVFRLKSGQTYLHTGDFRAVPAMENYPALVGTKIHQLYLDTTYCDPAYSFPRQTEVIEFAVTLATKHIEACPTSLIVCGSYTIGKERVFIAIAEALQSKICVQRDKKHVLDCLEDKHLDKMVTLKPNDAQVHVLPMGKLNPTNLSEYLSKLSRFTSILALEPTGWSHSNRVVSLDQIKPKYSRNGVTIYGIPYSEHSSYAEMKRFTQFIRPDRILPTVNNGNPQARKKMEDIFRKWMTELKSQQSTNRDTTQTNKQVSLKTWFSK